MRPIRMIALWFPDWPVTAACLHAGIAATGPVAAMYANRVVACSQLARQAGVKRGQRRRDAQSRCPELTVLIRDLDVEAARFEPIIRALESVVPRVEINRPGLALIAAPGPVRYFGSEPAAIAALSRVLAGLPGGESSIGIADGAFAAEQAARAGAIVAPGGSADFLAGLPVTTLIQGETIQRPPTSTPGQPAGQHPGRTGTPAKTTGRTGTPAKTTNRTGTPVGGNDQSGIEQLIDLLARMGIHTLGAFAALPATQVLARFGPAGAWAHRQAGGRDTRPLAARQPPNEHLHTVEFDPPLQRVDTIAFSASATVERFVTGLARYGLACDCLQLTAYSDDGAESDRYWRQSRALSTMDILDRVRWQLSGWLAGQRRPSAGVVRLRLVANETVPLASYQQNLLVPPGVDDERAHRALARVQTLLGHGSVLFLVPGGGRTPGQRTRLVPFGDDLSPSPETDQPWPGRLPTPAPTVLINPPRPAQLLDDTGQPVLVTGRGELLRPPATIVFDGQSPQPIRAWAGPWPVAERWWLPSAQHLLRCQVVVAHQSVSEQAYLIRGIITEPAGDCLIASADAVAQQSHHETRPHETRPQQTQQQHQEPRWQVEAVYD